MEQQKIWSRRRGGTTMNSFEVARKRRKIEEEFMSKINIFNGQLTTTREEYLEKMSELQKNCPHVWDNGEPAVVKNGNIQICTICKKKMVT